jgi:hypothetical protein
MIRTGYFGSGCALHQVKLALPLSSRRMYATHTTGATLTWNGCLVYSLSSWPQTPLQHTSYLGTQSALGLGAQISGHDLVHAQISGHNSDPLAGLRCDFVLRGSRSSRAGGHKYVAGIEVAGPARACCGAGAM